MLAIVVDECEFFALDFGQGFSWLMARASVLLAGYLSKETDMKSTSIALLIAAAMMAAGSGIAAAVEKKIKVDYGRSEYQNSCILCHGSDGKGNGSLVELLKKKPTDLTSLSRNNNGVFPSDRIYSIIDGRDIGTVGHGDRDMPAWGNRYVSETGKAAEYYMDSPYDMEMYARIRIHALIDYLHRIQAK